jgi:hypothetical protein
MSAHNALALRMLIDQITPHLPKDNEEVNVHVKCLQAMLDAATMVDRSSTVMRETGVRSLTTGRVCPGTWPVVSLHRRSMAEGVVRMTVI